MMAWLDIAGVLAIFALAYYVQRRRERRRQARGPVPPAPGTVPTGAGRGPRFRMVVEVEGYDDRANADMVECDVRRALKSASGGVLYDVGSVDVRECRQTSTPADDSEYPAGHAQPSKTAP